jgi:Fur family ferric uptake transcriptional regulator
MIILEEVQKVKSHPTAIEVFELVRRRLPKISLGTVYRNLERLAVAGKIKKLAIAGTEARFDGDVDQHYHVRCVSCGRIADVYSSSGHLVREELKEVEGYQILGHRLEFVGICPKCKAGGDGGAGRTGPGAAE